MSILHIGQRVQRISEALNIQDPSSKTQKSGAPAWATVIYIHPEGRFHVVEFDEGVRESFFGTEKED